MSQLDYLIGPEIVDDDLFKTLVEVSSRPDVKEVLEIGASSGEGSTKALYEGLCQKEEVSLYCMEVSIPRYEALISKYEYCEWLEGLNTSSVCVNEFPTEAEVILFYRDILSSLNNFKLEDVLWWLRQDISYITGNQIDEGGIELLQKWKGSNTFDLVLIDGSEFTGYVELGKVYGSKIIVLDDINSFKNHQSFKRLSADPSYRLERVNHKLRNGFAIFERVE